MNLLIVIFSLLLSFSTNGDPFAGEWEGKLTHEGEYSESYDLYIEIKKDGDGYSGMSIVQVNDIYAKMEISGKLHGKELLVLEDGKVITHEIPDGMEWCHKSYQLRLSEEDGKIFLVGAWQGVTSFANCIPGKIRLERAKIRA